MEIKKALDFDLKDSKHFFHYYYYLVTDGCVIYRIKLDDVYLDGSAGFRDITDIKKIIKNNKVNFELCDYSSDTNEYNALKLYNEDIEVKTDIEYNKEYLPVFGNPLYTFSFTPNDDVINAFKNAKNLCMHKLDRYDLTKVVFDLDNGKIVMANGKILWYSNIPKLQGKIYIPFGIVETLAKKVKLEKLSFAITDDFYYIKANDDIEVRVSTHEVSYPDYMKVINNYKQAEIKGAYEIDSKRCKKALKTIKPLVDDDYFILTFKNAENDIIMEFVKPGFMIKSRIGTTESNYEFKLTYENVNTILNISDNITLQYYDKNRAVKAIMLNSHALIMPVTIEEN